MLRKKELKNKPSGMLQSREALAGRLVSGFHAYMSSLMNPSKDVMFYDLQTFWSQRDVHIRTQGQRSLAQTGQ